jgi:hypothetical protein
MIKRIDSRQLQIGMYVHDLDCGWMEHPFLRNRFAVSDSQIIQRIHAAGVRQLYVDTDRGKDAAEAPTQDEVQRQLQQELEETAGPPSDEPRVLVTEELTRARNLYRRPPPSSAT